MSNLKKPYYDLALVEEKFNLLYGEKTEFQRKRYMSSFDKFKSLYSVDCAYIASSSGRVEVIGNHVDHNGGSVLSCAISLDSLCFFLPTDDGKITLYSEGYGQMVVDTNALDDEKRSSRALIAGVVKGLKDKGFSVGGFNAYVTSNVVGGAGISSSASFEVLIAEIENFLYNDGKVTQEEKAIISQYAENVYFEKPCGLLDQTAISYGGLKKLDFSDKSRIKVTDIKNDLSEYMFILVNTGGSHENLTDEYASIPKEMFDVAKAYGKDRLIELSEKEFYDKLSKKHTEFSDRAVLRANHFFEENKRVETAVNALNDGMIEIFLDCIRKSGASSLSRLQNCYVAGGKEQSIPKALCICERWLKGGANRVHGGGFAGSILNIVSNFFAKDFVKEASKIYGKENVIPLHVRSVGTIVL